ncbi:hypothetical protein RHMOL_Rhmol07G0156900 [Rhododendron molle]|uniref:Uncharacterized protein n=1 Tax=Rhododendron molle TaxID=49168 RepID=A0ACC0N244_RHOML|nr:hypothetical protein RHMOL_Rhmol07G0156900 [Rhododendron molle]
MAQNNNRRLKIVAGADSFGGPLKDSLVNHLRSLSIDVEDLGTSDKYYSIGEEIGRRVSTTASSDTETRGLVACGTGVGVSIFANKFPGVYAATCLTPGDALNSRSINNSNVLAVSGMSTSPESAVEILDTWLNTPFKSPCPASDSKPWPTEIDSFLENSISEMSKIGEGGPEPKNKDTFSSCAICWLNSRNKDKPEGDFNPGYVCFHKESPSIGTKWFIGGSPNCKTRNTQSHNHLITTVLVKVLNLHSNKDASLRLNNFLTVVTGSNVHKKYSSWDEFYIAWVGRWEIGLARSCEFGVECIDGESKAMWEN